MVHLRFDPASGAGFSHLDAVAGDFFLVDLSIESNNEKMVDGRSSHGGVPHTASTMHRVYMGLGCTAALALK